MLREFRTKASRIKSANHGKGSLILQTGWVLSNKEVRAMWNFDLSQTKAGQELILMANEKGEKKSAIKIAKKLLSLNDISIEKIAEITDLKLDEIRSLQVSRT